MTKFHAGELAIQKQAGVEAMARRVGNGIYPYIFDAAADFLLDQSLVVIASTDSNQQVWASVLTATPGFLQPLNDTTLAIFQIPLKEDPLSRNLVLGQKLGLLAIDLAARLRVRVNGTLIRLSPDSFVIETQEVYGNCQKYIQARTIVGSTSDTGQIIPKGRSFQANTLTQDQKSWIAKTDTFFIASQNPAGGSDASHRGGNPGFVQVLSDSELLFPDYSGNMMFNTLGNIAVNPSAGLLFPDFETGHILQLTGSATIIWEPEQVKALPGAERLVKFEITEVIESGSSLGFRFGAPNHSRFNPR